MVCAASVIPVGTLGITTFLRARFACAAISTCNTMLAAMRAAYSLTTIWEIVHGNLSESLNDSSHNALESERVERYRPRPICPVRIRANGRLQTCKET